MNGDDKTAGQSLQESLYARMQSIDSLDAVSVLLDEALASCAELGVQNAFRLARSLCSLALDLTEAEPNLAAEFIISHVIPWCDESRSASDNEGHLDIETHRLRDVLSDWIYSYPFEQMAELRRIVLEDTLARLRTDPQEWQLFLVSEIGFRTEEIGQFLWKSVADQGPLVDTALSTLIALGPEPDEKARILTFVSAQLDDGLISKAARYAVQEL